MGRRKRGRDIGGEGGISGERGVGEGGSRAVKASRNILSAQHQ